MLQENPEEKLQIAANSLRNLRKKWRTASTKEKKMARELFGKYAYASGEKSVGISIGFEQAAHDIDRLIRILES